MTAFDSDGDGVYDSMAFDTNSDGYIDAAGTDANRDGILDTYIFDDNQDGYFESVGVPANQDGRVETRFWDTNGDGRLDTRGDDVNFDGQYEWTAGDTNFDGTFDTFTPGGGTSPAPVDSTTGMPENPSSFTAGGEPQSGWGKLMIDMANQSGTAVWGTPDSDGDGWKDDRDYDPNDRYRH